MSPQHNSKHCEDNGKVYDIIFAGGEIFYLCFFSAISRLLPGGACGCLIAGRLAAADPSLRLLILEAGPHTRGLNVHRQPARYMTHQDPAAKMFTFNVAKPSEKVGDRAVVVPCARCVGGGSSVNCKLTRSSTPT